MATVSISSYFAISYLGVFGKYVPFFQLLKTSDAWHVGATIALIGFLIVINIIGIQESSALNLTLAITDLITQVVLVVLGIILLLNIRTVLDNIHWGIAPNWGNFLASISIAMVTYTGIETISNLSEEAKNPGRSVPRATFAVIIAVLFVAAFLPTIGLSVFPVHFDAHGVYITTSPPRGRPTRWPASSPASCSRSHSGRGCGSAFSPSRSCSSRPTQA